jgi:hypothetical protein
MWARRGWKVAVVVAAVLPLAACGGSSGGGAADKVSKGFSVAQIEGTDLNQITLTKDAATRLGIATVSVETGTAAQTTVIPYAAVLYDPDGKTWTYTSPKPLSFVRHDITVETIDDTGAVLTAGPPAGTSVVTVGADELWGIEYGGIEED